MKTGLLTTELTSTISESKRVLQQSNNIVFMNFLFFSFSFFSLRVQPPTLFVFYKIHFFKGHHMEGFMFLKAQWKGASCSVSVRWLHLEYHLKFAIIIENVISVMRIPFIFEIERKNIIHEHKFGAKWCLKAEQSCFYFVVWILIFISLQGIRNKGGIYCQENPKCILVILYRVQSFQYPSMGVIEGLFGRTCSCLQATKPSSLQNSGEGSFKAGILVELIIHQKQNMHFCCILLFFLITNTVHAQSMR